MTPSGPLWRSLRLGPVSPTAAKAVPDEVFNEAAKHYDEQALGALVVEIAAINAWNRLNVISGQVTGEWVKQWVA